MRLSAANNIVWLYGPQEDYYVWLDSSDNRSCVCRFSLSVESPAELFPSAVDCSTKSYPAIFFGSGPRRVRFYDSDNPLAAQTFALLAEHRVVTEDSLEVYPMNGSLPAGCEPVSSSAFTPPYKLRWPAYPGICGVETGDYRAADDFFHPDVRKSYMDFYRIHDGAQSGSVSGFRTYEYDPLSVPPFRTEFSSRTTTTHTWVISAIGGAQYHDQDGDVARVQVSAYSNFSSIYAETSGAPFMDDTGYGPTSASDAVSMTVTLARGTIYYARCRYESTDGSVVGPWSNVFELNGDTPVSHNNHYSGTGFVAETHYYGDEITHSLASNPFYMDGHTYALIYRRTITHAGASKTMKHALLLANYDGSSVTLQEIEGDTFVANHGAAFMGWPVRHDILSFDGKVYAGWSDLAVDKSVSIFDWCEITDGVIGTIHHVQLPESDTELWVNWATLINLFGRLTVVASLDTGTDYRLAIADVLSDDATMQLTDIGAGFDYEHDPWGGSLWFDYENYDGSETGLCWLKPDAFSFPWIGKFQLSHVTA